MFLIYTEPLPPGILNRELSNFSANHLFLKWNPPDGNTTLNHYRVVIDGYQQQTLGSTPEIYWHKTLTPGTIYNVTITTISRGGIDRSELHCVNHQCTCTTAASGTGGKLYDV